MTYQYTYGNSAARRRAFATASVMAMTMAAFPAYAQSIDPSPTVAKSDVVAEDTGTITVTGSRIARDGFTAPTPVNVLGEVDIKVQSPPNISDFVASLPSIQGSSNPSSATGSVSGAQAGISSISLRGLGAGRTLVLLDGQRSVASSTTGAVDINTFPQSLVERVEVVTGGASAAYGSDAIGGVVNFILRKNFTGLEINGDYGETTFGDGQNYNITATAGAYLLDKRLHVMANAQYFLQEHIPTNNREWNKRGYNIIPNPDYVVGNGAPEFFIGNNTGPQRITPGGIIVTGPLRGTTFGSIDPRTGTASVGQLTYGAAQNDNSISMLGGDWQETSRHVNGSASFEPGQERIGAFGRATFEVTPNFEVSFTAAYNKQTVISNFLASVNNGNLTIRRDNAFLPASVAQAMDDNGLSSIRIGTSNLGLPAGGANFSREVYRYVLGAKGDFDLGGYNWNWDAYYQRGFSRSNERTNDVWNNARVAAATNAVRAEAGNPLGVAPGTIVCLVNVDSNPNNDMPGCIPMNRIGENGQSAESINYILNDGNQPLRFQRLQQDVAALTLSGELFDLPGGPVGIAFGGEWRKEQVDSTVDPIFNSGWQYGNYRENRGEYTVKEAFVELALPIFTGAEINGAARVTDYSTSGTVATWKVGATWQPIDDLRFRGTVSRDIRASSSAAPSTSAKTILPPGPEPLTEARSTPLAAATRRANGEAATRPSFSLAGAGLGSGAGSEAGSGEDSGDGFGDGSGEDSGEDSGAGLALALGDGAASSSPAMRKITVPTGTSSLPASTKISETTPSSMDSNSIEALSVSISHSTSPDLTVSPTATSHFDKVPDSMVGESAGMVISIICNKPFSLPTPHHSLSKARLSQDWQRRAVAHPRSLPAAPARLDHRTLPPSLPR